MDFAKKNASLVGLNRRALAAAAIVGMAMLPVFPLIAAQNGRPFKHWNVKYQAGAAPFPPEGQIAVTFEGKMISLRPKKGPEFSITGDAITAVTSSEKGNYGAVSRAEAKFVAANAGPGSCASDFAPCTAVVIITELLIVPSYVIKTTDRLVHIVWRDKGVDQEIVLKLSKSDYAPFLNRLEKATGRPWKDLHTEWTKVQQELKGAEPNKIEVRLDRKVKIANSNLDSGTYQVVPLEDAANHGKLYFFPGKQVNAEELAAVVSVEIASPKNEGDTLQVDYKQDVDGMPRISSIRTQSKIFRFP